MYIKNNYITTITETGLGKFNFILIILMIEVFYTCKIGIFENNLCMRFVFDAFLTTYIQRLPISI